MFYFLGFGLHRGVSPVMPAPTAQTFQLTFARERNHCPLAPQSLARCAALAGSPLLLSADLGLFRVLSPTTLRD